MAHHGSAATPAIYDLAEGVIWDDRARLVRWVDIRRGHVLAGSLAPDGIDIVGQLDLGQTVGAVALGSDGGLLMAAARCLATVSTSGTVSYGPDLLGSRRGVRFNDGAVDPQGRFVLGTLSLNGPSTAEQLMRVSPSGHVEVLREGIGLSNGVAFSPDGTTILHVDTAMGTVASHAYGPGAFDRSEPWVTVLADLPAAPDGLTVDSTGSLWVAQWGGSSVRRHALDGELLDIVTVDTPHVSSAAFVGGGLDILAITSAREGPAGPDDLAGAIFLAKPGTTGMPTPRWAGSTTTPSWLRREEEHA